MERKVAVVLSGCGYLDGAEITESVSSLIALSEEEAVVRVFAPDVDLEEVNHQTTEAIGNKRSVLLESARITRGNIEDLKKLEEKDFDAIVIPGGFGVAKNLSDFAAKGASCKVNEDLSKVIKDFHAASKPIGAFCIAPAVVAKVLGEHGPALTIGNDEATAEEIKKTGSEHVECRVDDYVTDRENKVITSPAYMYEAKPHEVYKGIRGAIRELMEMA
jgi:enhancing lycopene biosynthesis protein 2